MANSTRKCCGCKERFPTEEMIRLPAGWFHSMECSIQYAIKKDQAKRKRAQQKRKRQLVEKQKAERRDLMRRKQALKSKGDWMKEAQAAFNRFIRVRDYGKECISCDTTLQGAAVGGSYDAGHYLSRGARGQLRFNEDNCHGQCKRCNRYLGGNIADYRIKLVERIGLHRVLELEADHSEEIRTVEHYQAIKAKYSQKARELQKQIDSRLGEPC